MAVPLSQKTGLSTPSDRTRRLLIEACDYITYMATFKLVSPGRMLVLAAPQDATSTVHVATGTPITIKIGTNATQQQNGVHQIVNPSAPGTYTVSVGGTFGGSGNIPLSINAGFEVAATVAENLSLAVSPSVTSIKFVQSNFDDPGGSVTQTNVSFSSNNAAGNLIVVALDWDSQSVNVLSVTDTRSNAYISAVRPVDGTIAQGSWRNQIFYAKNPI